MFLLCAVRDVMAHPEAYACIRIWGLRKWIWRYRRFKEIRIPVRILGELKTGQGIMSSVAGFGQIYDTHSDDRSVSQVTQLDCLGSVLCLVSRNYFQSTLYTGLLPLFIVLSTSITSSNICPHLQGFAIPMLWHLRHVDRIGRLFSADRESKGIHHSKIECWSVLCSCCSAICFMPALPSPSQSLLALSIDVLLILIICECTLAAS